MAAFQSELGGELATLSATISRNVTTGLATALSVANAAMDRETSLDLLGTCEKHGPSPSPIHALAATQTNLNL